MKASIDGEKLELRPDSEAESKFLCWLAAAGVMVDSISPGVLPCIGFAISGPCTPAIQISLKPKP